MSSDTFEAFGQNAGYVEELYRLFLTDPELVDLSWQRIFSSGNFSLDGSLLAAIAANGGELEHGILGKGLNGHAQAARAGAASSAPHGDTHIADQLALRADNLLLAYRVFGHLGAKVNPLSQGVEHFERPPELDGKWSDEELEAKVALTSFADYSPLSISELRSRLEELYCGSIGFEFMHVPNSSERGWLQSRIENRFADKPWFSADQRRRFFEKLHSSENLDAELHKKYIGAKRFSIQGAETLIPMLDVLLDESAQCGVNDIVMGMAHRGRLNVLANIGDKPIRELFAEFEDTGMASVIGAGDVKYHLGVTSNITTYSGKPLSISLAPNPSHLEFVNPVVQGIVRAKQDALLLAGDAEASGAVMAVLIHGDAAFIGQGIVSETLNYSQTPGYKTGGTVHIIINNQVGFTTDAAEARSSTYCSDIAKIIGSPILHVNAEDVDSACWAMRLAAEYRRRFKRDIVIDLYCYRKFGHNEGDDPNFTQPLMYSEIKAKTPISKIYSQRLLDEGVLDAAAKSAAEKLFVEQFESEVNLRYCTHVGEACALYGKLDALPAHTGVDKEALAEISGQLLSFPEGFKINPKLKGILEKRTEALADGSGIDWGFAEALSFATLLRDGVSVRLSGQDCGRGTFSHRHAELHAVDSEERFYPLSAIAQSSGTGSTFSVYNSTLSEAGVLGFEFGYAAARSDALVMWEAQFGDFVNGAQVIVDQFIAASEVKWGQRSGIVLLLPHGFEGQGPEHSSARLERFLQLCAEKNMTVAYPSGAAQYFHLLRRHGMSGIKRPLVVMTPKSLLRLPEATAGIDELCSGGFKRTLETKVGSGNCTRIIFLSGKVYYDVIKSLEGLKLKEAVLVVRIEELYPFPETELRQALMGHSPSKFIWVQEEPANMGPWSYIAPRLGALVDRKITYVGRPASASPACGSVKWHAEEIKRFLAQMASELA